MQKQIQLFILVVMAAVFAVGCNQSEVNGQSNTEKTSNDCKTRTIQHSAANGSENLELSDCEKHSTPVVQEEKLKKTRDKLDLGIVKLKSKLQKENLSVKDLNALSKLLGWNGYCDQVNFQNDLADEKHINLPFHKLSRETYLLELGCNIEGAYLGGYLFYLIDEKTLTAQLLKFETFELRDEKIGRYISYYMVGESGFDDDNRVLYFRHKFAGAGQCGWEAKYDFKDQKANLVMMKAQWDCQAEWKGNDPSWQKLNLEKLRKTTKTYYQP